MGLGFDPLITLRVRDPHGLIRNHLAGAANRTIHSPHRSCTHGLSYEFNSEPCAARADAGPDRSIECLTDPDRGGTRVTLDGRGSRDPDETGGSTGIVSSEWFEDLGLPTERFLGQGELLDVFLPVGAHAITLRVSDRDGQGGSDAAVIEVRDTQPPVLRASVSKCRSP